MAKLTTSDLSSLTNQASAIATINANFALVETAMENTLSRDGTSPNTMTADLDMNSNDILNGGSASFTVLTVGGDAISDFVQAAEDAAAAAAVDAAAADASASAAAASAASITGYVAAASASAVSASAAAVSASASNLSALSYATSASASNVSAQSYATSASAAAASAEAYAGGVFYNFDSSTTMADPGTGDLRLDNATLASVTNIAFSATSAATGGPDLSDFIVTWDDSTNTTIKGTLVIREGGDPSTLLVYNVTGTITDNGTWLQVPVTHVTSSGTLSAGDDLYLSFTRAGNKGADGAGNVASVTAADTSITVAGTAADPTISRAALTGDVTASAGSNSTTIANNAVTYAKMQDVSAASRILGRKTAGAGDPEELTLSETLDLIGSAAHGDVLFRGAAGWQRLGIGAVKKVLRSAGAGADLTWEYVDGTMIRVGSDAQGDILYFNGTDWARLGAGTSGHFLKTQGTGANPLWAAPSSGGATLVTSAAPSAASLDFTGIPSGVKSIICGYATVGGSAVASTHSIQIGDSGGIETTGYAGRIWHMTATPTVAYSATYSAGFEVGKVDTSITSIHGLVHLVLSNSSTNQWTIGGLLKCDSAESFCYFGGSKALSGELDRVRFLTSAGTYTSGHFFILYQ